MGKTLEGYHRPVLLGEVIEALNVKSGEWYIDATLGDGGYSLEILKLGGNVVGIDVDPQALERAKGRLGKKAVLIRGNFRNLKNLLEQTGLKEQKFRGVLFDLGVSSLQLEVPQRGFSFLKEGPLDMRMDPDLKVLAMDLINAGGRKELYALFTKLGEEKFAKAIADTLVRTRWVRPIETTTQLAELVMRVVDRQGRVHPATRIFQALRIAVNDELKALEEGLDQVVDLTQKYGHILVLSYHSLEDRITKFTFKKWQDQKLGKVLTKKPIVAGVWEIKENPGSRSAKMRIFEVRRR